MPAIKCPGYLAAGEILVSPVFHILPATLGIGSCFRTVGDDHVTHILAGTVQGQDLEASGYRVSTVAVVVRVTV